MQKLHTKYFADRNCSIEKNTYTDPSILEIRNNNDPSSVFRCIIDSLAKFKEREATDENDGVQMIGCLFGEESFCKVCDKSGTQLILPNKYKNIYRGRFGIVGRARDIRKLKKNMKIMCFILGLSKSC